MITVTEEAKMLLTHVVRPEGTVLRLEPVDAHPENGEAQIGLCFGEPSDDDQVVEHEERDLLRISWSVSEALDGGTIQTVNTPEGPKIDILPPPPEDALGPEPSVNGSS
jgi:hypothetical protein